MFWILTFGSIVALGLVLATLADRLQRRALQTRLDSHLGSDKARIEQHAVIILTSQDLGSGKPPGRLGQPGFLLIEAQGVRVVRFVRDPGAPAEEVCIEARSEQVGWIPVNSLSLGMTSLIRLPSDSGYYYLAARGRWGSPSSRCTRALKDLLARRFRCKRIETPPDHTTAMGLKVGLVVCLASSLVAALFAFRSADLLGPEILAGQDNRLAVASKSEITLMNSDGGVLRRFSLSELGIEGRLTEIQWAGDSILYLGDGEAGTIVRCELEPVSCKPLPGLEKVGLDLLGAFSFALDLTQQRIYLADSGNHRVLVLDLEGGLITEFQGADRRFCFPNSLRLAQDNSHFYLSDTNNFRLRAFSTDPGQPVAVAELEHRLFVSSLPPESGCRHGRKPKFHEKWLDRAADFHMRGKPRSIGVARPDRVWGFDTLRDHFGRWWLIVGDGNLRRGDLLSLDNSWTEIVRVELPEGADPASMTQLGEDLLVADPLRPAIYRVNAEDLSVSEFGSADYRDQMLRIASGQKTARLLYYSGLGLALLFLLLVLLLAVSNQRRQVRRILDAEA